MIGSYVRPDGRQHDELRQVRITPDPYGYACASLLLELGNTKVLSSVTIAKNVPPFLKGKKSGWLTAEYSMLPAATPVRTVRVATTLKPAGRSIEISRLIGRSLRAMVDLSAIEERTIMVDCDVLQADGGTRTACITAASLALQLADARLRAAGVIAKSFIIDDLAGVSVGIMSDAVLLDLSYAEDSTIDADINFVINSAGKIVEVQGAAEHAPISWQLLSLAYERAEYGAQLLREACARVKEQVCERPLPDIVRSLVEGGRSEE